MSYRPTDGTVQQSEVVDEGYIVAHSFQEDAGLVHGDAGQVVDASGLQNVRFECSLIGWGNWSEDCDIDRV